MTASKTPKNSPLFCPVAGDVSNRFRLSSTVVSLTLVWGAAPALFLSLVNRPGKARSDRQWRMSEPLPYDAPPTSPGSTAPLTAAATVILARTAREPSDGKVEVLMLQRVGRGAFAGMWVFPGGKVDLEDRVAITDIELASELATARIAAAREAMEETGLAVAPLAMAPLSHWMPPPSETRRFSTWFFVAPAPSGEIALAVDEATAHQWITPEDALAANSRGELPLAPPTWMTLHHLSGSSSVDDLTGGLRLREPLRMHTRVVNREPLTLVWAGDVAYEHADDAVDPTAGGPRHRLVMHSKGWSYERS